MPRKQILTPAVLNEIQIRHANGENMKELASIVGVSHGTLRNRLSRYRKENSLKGDTSPMLKGDTHHELKGDTILKVESNNTPAPIELKGDTSPRLKDDAPAKVKGDTARKRIITYLENMGGWTISQIADELDLLPTTVQKSIERMPGGIITSFQNGKIVLFRLDTSGAFSIGREFGRP